ncbi:MAG: hypothetical protein KI793_27140, partial [Rivularia sp. (in: Bacteria)]|nr:hypothetical protein [Rivularia sp. MS3]
KGRIFQLEGKDNFGITDFKQDVTGKGWQTYKINVGDYFNGNINHLLFTNDHDNGSKNAHSQFRSIKIYEGSVNKFNLAKSNNDLNSDVLLTVKDSINNYNLSSYGGKNQDKGTFDISDDKTEVQLTGNSWKKLDITNYNITNNTVLKFEFQSNTQGEVQGIGFDNDNIINGGDRAHFLQVSGTQDWGIELDEYTIGSEWQTYEVRLGDYDISGNFNYLTLGNDHDVSNANAHSQFRNISLYEM